MAPAASRVPLAEHRADAIALLTPLLRTEHVPVTWTGEGPGHRSPVGRVLAADVRAAVNTPGWDNSQMDGFAVAAANLRGENTEVTLPVGEPIPAGQAPSQMGPGTARPIMTGAPIPRGADLVIPIEEAVRGGYDSATVTLRPLAAEPGRFVRRAGSDTHAGDVIGREGEEMTPARLAHLASCGIREVPVLAPVPTVVLSTGSEVTDPAAPRPEGGAYDANGPGLAAALADAGAQVLAVERVPDDPALLMERLAAHAAAGAELVVTSGGVSEGAYEVVRQAASLPGAELSITKVAMQPGGPQGIGTAVFEEGRLAWLAFPGNPVSALLSCELLARPALRAPARRRLELPLRLEQAEPSPGALLQFRRARVLPSGHVRLCGGPSSHLLGALSAADALVEVPVGVTEIRDGDRVWTTLLR